MIVVNLADVVAEIEVPAAVVERIPLFESQPGGVRNGSAPRKRWQQIKRIGRRTELRNLETGGAPLDDAERRSIRWCRSFVRT